MQRRRTERARCLDRGQFGHAAERRAPLLNAQPPHSVLGRVGTSR